MLQHIALGHANGQAHEETTLLEIQRLHEVGIQDN